MKPLDIAMKYMEVLFSGKNMEELRPLLSDNFTFQGPLYSFSNPNDYVAALEKDPPDGFQYQILQTFETGSVVCLVYEFNKPGISTTMVQVFKITNGKIESIILIFDTAAFTS